MIDSAFAPILKELEILCADYNSAAWLVGGAVRDLAQGYTPHDLDFAVAGDGLELARLLADRTGGAFVALDDERGTGRIVYPVEQQRSNTERLTLDLARLRAPTLEDDLLLRDFTINALALPLEHLTRQSAEQLDRTALVDPCGGWADIASRTLRPCLPSSLHDDPLRSLRAFRFAAASGLTFAPGLEEMLREAAPLIKNVAPERVRDELLKLLALPDATAWLHRMDDIGLLTQIFPELEPARDCDQPIVHFLPVLGHMLETVTCIEWLLEPLMDSSPLPDDHLPAAVQKHPDLPRTLPYADRFHSHFQAIQRDGYPRTALFKLATLLHDNAKPQTKQPKAGGGVTFYGHQSIGAQVAADIARRLRLSRQSTGYTALVVREHMRPGQLRGEEQVTPRAVARFFRDTDDAGPDVLLHGLADHLAARGPHVDRQDWQHHLEWTAAMLDAYWGQPPEQKQPLVNGNDLMEELDLQPGKLIGELLREIDEARAAGEIHSRAEALALARRMLEQWE